jgi:hypothetical protein
MTLKQRFEEIIHLPWDEFVAMEKGPGLSVDDEVLCSLVRLCADTDEILAAKLSFDRIDGLLEIPIEVKVPKFYIRYINAKKIEQSSDKQLEAGKETKKKSKTKYDPATAKLRETLQEVRKLPREVIPAVLKAKKMLDDGKQTDFKIPQVKHVMVANLLRNIRKGNFRAIELVFDQIDGKLTRTITLLGGEDVYVDDYTTLLAPESSVKDKNGYYIAENKVMTNQWLRGFANNNKGLEMLVEELDDD